tara:strand:+ start:2217 stop:2633 length:417 start_codon:yes stop_codon:yes gene_type:complete
MIGALLPILGPIVGNVMDRILPEDKNKRMEIERELNIALMQNSQQIEQAAASVILAESKSEHFITATWRPILMLTITAIVGWNYLLAPLVELAVRMYAGDQVPLSIPLPEELWNLLMIGVGGYVVGRSGEKIAKNIKK